MNVYRLIQDSEDNPKNKKYKSAMIDIDESSLDFDRYDVDKGIPFEKWNNNIIANYEYKENCSVTDYVANVLAWFMVTEKFMKLLIDLKVKGLQFHPIILRCKNKVDADVAAYLVNVLSVIAEEAIDFERSEYFYYGESIGEKLLSVHKYCLKSSLIDGNDIFRIREEKFTSGIFVSKKIKKAIEDNRITGCDFSEIMVI